MGQTAAHAGRACPACPGADRLEEFLSWFVQRSACVLIVELLLSNSRLSTIWLLDGFGLVLVHCGTARSAAMIITMRWDRPGLRPTGAWPGDSRESARLNRRPV